MSIPVEKKIKLLKEFASHLDEPGWNSREGYGAANIHEMKLLENFNLVIQVYSQMKPEYQRVVKDITQRMADGMSHFAQNKVVTIDDYNLYCHYVAGLVGIGLSKLFHHSGLEGERFANLDALSNSMGLFLQKTNITRDYLEDILENPPRIFYPKDIWSLYTDKIENFKLAQHRNDALKCLNHMVANAVGHLSDCLDYMKLVQEPSVFKFCAIPQVMAIATLERCYNNPNVFTSEVKIRKGEAVRLMMGTNNYQDVCHWFNHYIDNLSARLVESDPSTPGLRTNLKLAKEKIAASLRA
jgi:farnesyl-diphosphate farnesyltransferase